MSTRVDQAASDNHQAASELRLCTSRLKRAIDAKLKKASEVEIIVNGREIATIAEELSFEDVVVLAGYPAEANPSVVYSRGRGGRKGILHHGVNVKVSGGMIFDAVYTGNA